MIGSEEVGTDLEPAVALVDVVGGIRGEVGLLAVAANEHAVLVIAEVGRAEPYRAVPLEDVALLAQLRQGPLDGARVVQRPLGRPDVEVGTERVQLLLLLGELNGVAGLAKATSCLLRWAASGCRGGRRRLRWDSSPMYSPWYPSSGTGSPWAAAISDAPNRSS